jgi:N-methylhydantoinase A/oxoprolinase/acetone carboxylase beta subunit
MPRAKVPFSIRIGVDTGGTFTDFVIWKDGRVSNKKVLSTPRNPSLAILEGLAGILGPSEPVFIVHGTTVATNALLERKGGKIALITTEGFEDVLAIGRQTRLRLYSLQPEERHPLLPREMCFGLRERTLASGAVERGVDRAEVRRILRKIRATGAEAVAVCLLHSYVNPGNERAVAAEIAKTGLMSSISSRILPEYREFERMTATAVNAYLMPVMAEYIADLTRRIRGAQLRIMQSNEGYISPPVACREPIKTALSGPAGGVVGAHALARAAGFPNIVSFDMGGTSTDVSLIEGSIGRTQESRVGPFPVRLPMIDIHSVGAGGGSIAVADRGGSLRVGPESAGADPGPACYGKGDLPTVTDANLYLGRLDADYFLGGRMKIHPGRSRAALERLARRIGRSALETALGIIDIANANMEKAIRVISVERGFDARDFALFPFGGAGGMHAVEMAGHLGMRSVLVPKNAGVLSAFGLLMADSIKDSSRSVMLPAAAISRDNLERRFREIEASGLSEMRKDGFAEGNVVLERSLDCRYFGQSYEINMPCRRGASPKSLLADFERLHEKMYSYRHQGRDVEIVNLRVKAVAVTPKIPLTEFPERRSADPRRALLKTQGITTRSGRVEAPVYDRSRIVSGMKIRGPALLIDPESTTYLPPGYGARADRFLNLVVSRPRRK